MKHEKLQSALSQISDSHIAEAAQRQRKFPYWGALAACLALVLVVGTVIALFSGKTPPSASMEGPPATQPTTVSSSPEQGEEQPINSPLEIFTPEIVQVENLLASPQYPELAVYSDDYEQWELWRAAYQELHKKPKGYIDNLNSFFAKSIPEFLSAETNENTVYSPISLYMALSMLAQTTGGDTQQEILTLLGAEDAAALAKQAGLVWRNHYWNDGANTSILANSLWLDDAYQFRQETVDLIADSLYASVYQGALESPEMNIALKDWLNAQTGGLLEDSIRGLDSMDELTALVLASTINYRCKWRNEFAESLNTSGVFHGASGDQTVTFMNQTTYSSSYFWGDDFSATYLVLEDGSRLWLVLPDEGYTLQDILASGYALDTILQYHTVTLDNLYPNQKQLRINLSLPKFDVTGELDLMQGLKNLGITQASDPENADFSGIDPVDQGLYLGGASHAARVAIDEEGLIAASYTVMLTYGAAEPPEEEVDFVLDRPFLFVVESEDGVPMFTGIVNQP